MQNGYYYATFDSVTISCYNASKPPGTNTGVSYTYNNVAGTNDTVVDGNKPTVLKSFLGSGLNMNSGASSVSGSSKPTTPATIPGFIGGSPGSNPDASVSAANPGSTSSPGGSSSGSGDDNSFSQSSGSGSGSGSPSSASSFKQEKVLKGSVFAAIVAVIGMMSL